MFPETLCPLSACSMRHPHSPKHCVPHLTVCLSHPCSSWGLSSFLFTFCGSLCIYSVPLSLSLAPYSPVFVSICFHILCLTPALLLLFQKDSKNIISNKQTIPSVCVVSPILSQGHMLLSSNLQTPGHSAQAHSCTSLPSLRPSPWVTCQLLQ